MLLMEFEEFRRLFHSRHDEDTARNHGKLDFYDSTISLLYGHLNRDDLTPDEVKKYRAAFDAGKMFQKGIDSVAELGRMRDMLRRD
jgi:hypothetical protein